MTFDELTDICYIEMENNSQLISVSIVVRDSNSGDVRVYNSNQYGGVDKYNDYC